MNESPRVSTFHSSGYTNPYSPSSRLFRSFSSFFFFFPSSTSYSVRLIPIEQRPNKKKKFKFINIF